MVMRKQSVLGLLFVVSRAEWKRVGCGHVGPRLVLEPDTRKILPTPGSVIHQTLPSLPSLAPPTQEGSGNQTRGSPRGSNSGDSQQCGYCNYSVSLVISHLAHLKIINLKRKFIFEMKKFMSNSLFQFLGKLRSCIRRNSQCWFQNQITFLWAIIKGGVVIAKYTSSMRMTWIPCIPSTLKPKRYNCGAMVDLSWYTLPNDYPISQSIRLSSSITKFWR